MEQPLIQYARSSDGVNIAYHEFGQGPPLVFVACCPFSHVQRDLAIPIVSRWWKELARTSRIVRYDGRGNGLSDRSAADFSLDAQVRDLETVLDHLSLSRVALLAAAVASPAAISFAARCPARVSHLVLWHGFARATDMYRGEFGTAGTIARRDWDFFIRSAAHIAIGWEHGELANAYADSIRAAVDQQTLLRHGGPIAAQDVTDRLPHVAAPTLVLARRDVPVPGTGVARALAAAIPNARLLILEGATPAPYLGDRDAVLNATREFLASESPGPTVRPNAIAAAALTERETEVLSLLAGGRTGREIADALGISLSTAQRHIANIYGKIGARGRVDAAAYALSRGLVTPRE